MCQLAERRTEGGRPERDTNSLRRRARQGAAARPSLRVLRQSPDVMNQVHSREQAVRVCVCVRSRVRVCVWCVCVYRARVYSLSLSLCINTHLVYVG